MADRSRAEQDNHDAILKAIAKIRFPFPNREHPNWKTFVNHPDKEKGIKTDHDILYPDIVVADTGKNEAVMAGEIETAQSVNAEEAKQWKDYAGLCDFYLYVPEGYSDEAKRLSKNATITGYREYSVDRNGKIIITVC